MNETDRATALVRWNAEDHRHHGQECEELICCVCRKNYSVWYADDDLWNRVMRDGEGRDLVPFACARCFLMLAGQILPVARITVG